MAYPDRSGRGPGLPARPIYLDYNATTPVDPLVLEALLPSLERDFGNPSSAHAFGDAPRRALGLARARVAALLGAAPDQVVFTAGGSESDALAIHGTVRAALARQPHVPPHVVTQTTEHPAVLAACAALEQEHGVAVTYLPVDRDGLVDPAAVEAALRPQTVLVSLMAANNETGTLQPVREVGAITRARGVLLHVDAAQAAGKVEVDVASWGADLLTVVGHKMYAPKGIGALYVAPGVALRPLVAGGGQERGLRAGTENVALAVALGAASDLARLELAAGRPKVLAVMRDLLERRLAAQLPGRVRLNGHRERRLPQTLNVSIDGVRGHELLAAVPDVAASTGSACHAGEDAPSPVLLAMGLGPERAMAAVRLSLGRWSTTEDVCAAADLLARAAAGSLRPVHPGPRALGDLNEVQTVGGAPGPGVLLEPADAALDQPARPDVVAAQRVGQADADLREALPQVTLLLGAGLPPRLQHLVGREGAALLDQRAGRGQGLVRGQRLLGDRLDTGLAVREGTPERVAGPRLPGASRLVAVPSAGGHGVIPGTSGGCSALIAPP